MSDTLQKICAQTLIDLEKRKQVTPFDTLNEKIKDASPPRGFINALRTKRESGVPALIAEVKKASPSKGLIRPDFNPTDIAKSYEKAGAACLSVLTDAPFFQGDDAYLIAARSSVALPVLRKDFMLEPYQIAESRVMGADCILLIVAALDDATLAGLYELAKNLDMDVLVEVHNEDELKRALVINPEMLGVNNRNLKTLKVDTNTARNLAPLIPSSSLKVAESGIGSHEDILGFQDLGYGAFLVGESLMRQQDIESATKKLLGIA